MSRANLLTALVAASTCLALYCALGRLAGVHTSLAMYAFDLVVLFGAALLFLLFQRRRWLAGLVFTSAYALLAWAAMEKYRLLGLWVRAGDVALVDEAWQVSSPSERTLVALFAASIVAGAAVNLRRPDRRWLSLLVVPWLAMGAVSLAAPGPVAALLRSNTNAGYGHDPLYRSALFAVYFDLLETARFARASGTYLRGIEPEDAGIQWRHGARARNVHLVVLESLMDPAALGVVAEPDPIDPRLRGRIGGESASPVFAGRSAQAEFELLCGTPAFDLLDPVTFNELRGGPIPCLPEVLHRVGYATIASQDVAPGFFNSRQAYRSLGFRRTYFRGDFPTDDRDGEWVSSAERLRFNLGHIEPLLAAGRPFLNYVFLTAGHRPYRIDPVRRPPRVSVQSTAEVARLANALYYNTRAVADYVDVLLARDPAAIIVITGDHQGALPSIDYTRRGAKGYERYLVPYVFLDAGTPLHLGDLAHFDLPGWVLAALEGGSYRSGARTLGVELVRPLGRTAFYRQGGRYHECPDLADRRCEQVDGFRRRSIGRWLRLVEASRLDGAGR